MVADKATSPSGEEFLLAEEPASSPPGQASGERTEQLWATKEGDVFLYADGVGNLNPSTGALAGLYHSDTRFLSELMLLIDGRVPTLLSTSTERGFMSHIDLSNMDTSIGAADDDMVATRQDVNIRRTRVLSGRLYERVRLRSYAQEPSKVRVTMTFGADFADIFEVRGRKRAARGRLTVPKASDAGAVFAYVGSDGTFRETRITFQPTPASVEVRGERIVIAWRVELPPSDTQVISLTVEPRAGAETPPPGRYDTATHELRRSYEAWERDCTQITSTNALFDNLLSRGRRDLRALLTPTEHGDLPAAGIPWFVAPFGRDALMACHQTLMLTPDMTRTTLRVLAGYQGTQVNPETDEEPGKIMHELRRGELAGAGEIPHTPSYTAVDSTPLWLLLLGTYWRWTGDLGFCRELLPAVEAACEWMDTYGDRDGDGFISYLPSGPNGRTHHGWKHSEDAVVHPDGRLARGPIALAEVQGYAYQAKLRIAEIYEALGASDRAVVLRAQAAALRQKFNEAFWVESEQYFAFALDGDRQPVTTVTSNPAHGLYCDLLEADRAAVVARRLLAPDMFSGWGIRTMSKSAPAYNPMSHHNGSIWPHDNAFIAAGLKRYGYGSATNRVATAMLELATTVEYMRLPELFCGFTRRPPNRPVAYPVACSPQAWSAGAPFLVLQAMLGISARAPDNTLTVNKPLLPAWLDAVTVRNLRVGQSTISLVFTRQGDTTSFSLIDRDGDVRVLMEE